jgi:hypothetical protein
MEEPGLLGLSVGKYEWGALLKEDERSYSMEIRTRSSRRQIDILRAKFLIPNLSGMA